MQVFQTVAQLKATSGVLDNSAQVLGYYTPGDGGGGDFYWDPSAAEPENGGTIFELTTGGSGRWKRIYNEAINVRWFGINGANDNIAFAGALGFCKKNAIDLFIPSGTYNASIILDWCVPQKSYDGLIRTASYNPADPTQGTEVGRSFNIRGEANTTLTGDITLRRCRDMSVSDIRCRGNFMAVACELIRFIKIRSRKTASLAYYSDSFADTMMKRKYFLTLPPLPPGQTISDGGCYWLAFNNCFFESGFVIGGSDQVQHNVINFTNCNFNGGRVSEAVTNPTYLDHHGAGLYIKMREGHSDGITLVNCDLSYNDFPLFIPTNTCAATMIGCYYESCTYNFLTRDGIEASDKAATIINGFDYDRDVNQRIELRASRWALSGSRSSSDNYARLMIPENGGEISIRNEKDDKPIGTIVNRLGTAGNYGKTIGYSSISEEFEQGQAMSMGLRHYQNYNTHGMYRRVSIMPNEAVNISLVSLRPWENPSAIPLKPMIYFGNAHIRLTAVGGVQGNTAGQPLVYEGWSELKGNGTWTIPELLSGNLGSLRLQASFFSSGSNDLVCSITRANDAFGSFTGTIHMEITLDVREHNGGIAGWRID